MRRGKRGWGVNIKYTLYAMNVPATVVVVVVVVVVGICTS